MKLKAVIVGALLCILLITCCACSGGGTDNPPPGTQVRPVANAGPNRYCTVGEELTFDGSGSKDEDGDALTFQWELVELPATSQAAIVNPETPSPSITIDVEGIYALQLIVNDGHENSIPDIVRVATAGMLIDSQPDTITVGTDNIVYLLSTSNSRIYRWSLSQQFPLNPIDVGASPTLMAYASTAEQLYLGYASGAITQIDLTSGLQESPFATLPDSPHGLASAGNYILAADASGAWNTHYIYALDGRLVTSDDWNERSREYAWNPANSRIYFFRDGTSPNDLHYEEIDQDTGQITGSGETPYHGDYSIQPPIRVSKDGALVLLGSGDLYDADSLELVNSLPITVADAAWMDEGLLTLRTSPDERTLLEQWNTDLTLNNSQDFDGQPMRVFEWQEGYGVITMVDGKPAFNAYVP